MQGGVTSRYSVCCIDLESEELTLDFETAAYDAIPIFGGNILKIIGGFPLILFNFLISDRFG